MRKAESLEELRYKIRDMSSAVELNIHGITIRVLVDGGIIINGQEWGPQDLLYLSGLIEDITTSRIARIKRLFNEVSDVERERPGYPQGPIIKGDSR